MSKIIVDFNQDPCVFLIKTFRNVNLQAGLCKRNNDIKGFEDHCKILIALANKAKEFNFNIWVNENGQTGHDYKKDYKVTPDELHDYKHHISSIKADIERDIMNSMFLTKQETNN